MMPALLSPRAEDDLIKAMRWIARDNRSAARRLRQLISEAAVRIAEHPQVGIRRLDIASGQYRFLPLTGFPYVIVYHAEKIPPRIIRVLHGARDIPNLY
jgi:toxin ParE1/3/4